MLGNDINTAILVNNRLNHRMKMLRSAATTLLNKTILKEPLFAQNRFLCDGKISNSEKKITSYQNDKQIEKSTPEKQGYHSSIESDFSTGIQISSYSTVRIVETTHPPKGFKFNFFKSS